MQTARVVMPIVIACIVLHFFSGTTTTPPTTNGASTNLDEDRWFPLAVGNTWEYATEGAYRKTGVEGVELREGRFVRTVLKKRADGRFQIQDSADGEVKDNYYVSDSSKGFIMTSMSLDKREFVFLPLSFGPGSIWNITKTVRATADEDFDELDLPGLGTKPCLRVRYERYYDENVTNRPDWYFDGFRWFCKGVGVVKEDLRDAQEARGNRVEIKETWEVLTLDTVVLK